MVIHRIDSVKLVEHFGRTSIVPRPGCAWTDFTYVYVRKAIDDKSWCAIPCQDCHLVVEFGEDV